MTRGRGGWASSWSSLSFFRLAVLGRKWKEVLYTYHTMYSSLSKIGRGKKGRRCLQWATVALIFLGGGEGGEEEGRVSASSSFSASAVAAVAASMSHHALSPAIPSRRTSRWACISGTRFRLLLLLCLSASHHRTHLHISLFSARVRRAFFSSPACGLKDARGGGGGDPV